MEYLKKPYTVCVSTYQMAVLLAFNKTDSHSIASLLQDTQLSHHELTTTIQSLLDCKILLEQVGVATRQEVAATDEVGVAAEQGVMAVAQSAATNQVGVATGVTMATEDVSSRNEGTKTVYRLNMNYSNKRTKFKITSMMQKDTQQVCGEAREGDAKGGERERERERG
jgi:cullin 2